MFQPSNWKIVPEETHGYAVKFYDETNNAEATVKWDGCANMWWGDSDDPEAEQCYHHICDLNDTIRWLTQLRDRALVYFDTSAFCIGGWQTDEAVRDAIENVVETQNAEDGVQS